MKTRLFAVSLLPALLLILVFGLTRGVTARDDQRFEKPEMTLSADLTLLSISPSSFANEVNMPVTILGSNLDTVISATLGTVALRNLEIISSTQVAALVPWSIAPGNYDLKAMNSIGQSVTLTEAITVSAALPGWTSNGPYGGELYKVVVDPVDPSRVYVSAARSGLWKSQDGGAHWDYSLITLFPYQTQIVYPTSGQPPVMYLGGDANLGMVRSLDYGQNWVLKVPDEFNVLRSAGGVVVHSFIRPDQPNGVYVTFQSQRQANDPLAGLYHSTDRGDTWSEVISSTSGLNLTMLAFDPAQPDLNWVIGTDSGQVYTTTNGGVTWGDPITFNHANYIGGLVFAPTLNDEGHHTLWAISITGDSDNSGTDFAYRSADGGTTWTEVQVAPGSFNSGVAYHDSISGLLWSAVGHGYYSEDDGDTWHPLGAASMKFTALGLCRARPAGKRLPFSRLPSLVCIRAPMAAIAGRRLMPGWAQCWRARSPFHRSTPMRPTLRRRPKGCCTPSMAAGAGKACPYQLAEALRRLLSIPLPMEKSILAMTLSRAISCRLRCGFPTITAAPSMNMPSLCRLNLQVKRPRWLQLRLTLKPQIGSWRAFAGSAVRGLG